MKVKSIFLAVLFAIVFACDNEEKAAPKKTSLLTVNVDATFSAENSDDWIIIHDEKGALLAYESFENNQQLEIVTDKPVEGKIMVTHLNVSTDSNGAKWYSARSHANIEKGKTLMFKGVKSTPSQLKGIYNISVSDVYNLGDYWLSPNGGNASWSGGNYILELQSAVHTADSKHILCVSSGNSLKYKVLTDLQPDGQYNFSFDDMIPFEKKVKFTYPKPSSIWLYITGNEDGVQMPYPHVLMQRFESSSPTSIEAGYINALTNYRTLLQLGYSDYSYYYSNIGSIPDGNIEWPQPSDFNIAKTAVTDFTASSSKPFVWRSSTWRYQDLQDASRQVRVSWNIASSSNRQVINELPTEISSLYPEFSFKNLQYESTTFYTQSPEFNSVVNHGFGTETEPTGAQLGIGIRTK